MLSLNKEKKTNKQKKTKQFWSSEALRQKKQNFNCHLLFCLIVVNFFQFFSLFVGKRKQTKKKSKSFSGKSFPFLANHFFVLLLNALSKAMELFARTQTIVVPTNKWTLKEEKLKTGFAQKKWAYPDTDKQEPSEEKKNAFCKTELAAKRFFFLFRKATMFQERSAFFFLWHFS